MEGVDKIRKILEKADKVKSEVVVVEGAKHGFAIRGDKASEEQVKQEEIAFDQAVNWLGSRLGEGGRQ